tara:strand:- start:710 stop:2746 length:2037 start_codon:yes stop_codon:yes gene_type:complete
MEAVQEIIIEDLIGRFDKFFRTYYTREILQVIHGYPDEKSLKVNFDDLGKYDISLADEAISNPDKSIKAAEKALLQMDVPTDISSLKINVRFYNLPATSKIMITDIRSEHVGKLMVVGGIVRKATDVRPKLTLGTFECQRCGYEIRISQETPKLKKPYLCEECETKGPFKLIVKDSIFLDSQKILIQESLDDLRGGEHPKQLTIHVDDDLTGKITPGDSVELTGILRAIKKDIKGKHSRVFEIFLDTNSYKLTEIDFEQVEITREDKKRIMKLSRETQVYETIRDSIAPHIFGHKTIKEAIMYQLFSAPNLNLPDGGRIRGDSHIILMGEPATGKSEILQYVAKELAPRGIYTSGKGTSAAGLTAAALKDDFGDGGWSLEAGALVLADQGIACIDEFDKMEKEDRSSMHEAMEQQTVSIAKAGILATFRARCSILAAANPKFGRFDDYISFSDQLNLPPTILSRFDLIFFVRDNLEDSRKIAKHILNQVVSPDIITPKLEPEFLRKYIAYARKKIFPTLTAEAREKIEKYYVDIRELANKEDDQPIPLTTRQLWAIVRISTAASRVRLSTETTVEDVERAITLLNTSLKDAGMDMEKGKVDIDKIEIGKTRSQRDRVIRILKIIKEIEKEYGSADKSEIISRAIELGISEKETVLTIERLRSDNGIFDPNRNERYKVV